MDPRCPPVRLIGGCAAATLLLGTTVPGMAQEEPPDPTLLKLKQLSLEELVNQEVSVVSRRPERMVGVPSAVHVLSSEQIRRSGALTIPDALRLATGVHVAQSDGHTWAITARGFNASMAIANKMQVMLDGRSLYSPLFSGVFWDAQHYLLEDLAQIEVVRGPGATMWGANAFNGVINILTKEAQETQGTLLMGGGGNEANGFGGVRYGGQMGERTYYRVYATYQNWDGLQYANGSDAHDERMLGQTGFRTDTELNLNNHFTLQGDYYNGLFGNEGMADSRLGGGNLLARWTHDFSDESDLVVQAYFDKTHRKIADFFFEEDRDTFDLDAHHRFLAGEDHHVVWGFNYRLSSDSIRTLDPARLTVSPSERNLQLFSIFLQDEITLVQDYVKLTLGSKFEHNDFSGFEIQPSARLAYSPTDNQTLWAGISRAVRTPTRIDVDFHLRGVISDQSRTAFDSEELLALEIGYRIQPTERVTIDMAAFFNEYEDLRSFEPTRQGDPVARNELEGYGYGFELSSSVQLQEWWRLRASYSFLNTELDLTPQSMAIYSPSVEGNDPEHMFRLHSSMNLPYGLEFDQILRFVDDLPQPSVPSYVALDLRLAWAATEGLELAIVGRNLLDDSHPEFGSDTPLRHEVERSVYGKLTWRF